MYQNNEAWANFRQPWDTFLSIVGFNIFDSKYNTTKYKLKRYFGVAITSHFCLSCVAFSHSKNWDIELTSEAFLVTAGVALMLSQFITYMKKGEDFRRMSVYIEAYWREASEDECLFRILINRAISGRRNITILSVMVFATTFSFTLTSLYQRKEKVLQQVFPAYGLHKLDDYYYVFNFIYHEIVMIYPHTSLVPFHNIFAHITLQIAGQFEILGFKIARLGNEVTTTLGIEDTLRFCYYRHLDLIVKVKLISGMYSQYLYTQIICSTVLICLAMFLFLNNNSFAKISVSLFFFGAAALHLFIFSWYSEIINIANDGFVESIYNSSWEKLEIKHQRALTLILMKAQIPIAVSISGVINVGLGTFTLAVRTAYSWCALLCRLNE